MDATLIAHCRAGFESECAQDLTNLVSRARASLAIKVAVGKGFVAGACSALDSQRWSVAVAAEPSVFARSIFAGSGPHALTGRDRVTPLVALARSMLPPFGQLWLETPDTNDGKLLSGFCRRVEPLLTSAMQSREMLAAADDGRPRLHIMFTGAAEVYVGTSDATAGSPWRMGIPRISMPGAAPSRSTLKLAEAFLTFLSADERTELLRPGMRAVDLGAAPGGWTWQLTKRGLRVVAVDNGPLKGQVADDPLVQHLRHDGFTYRPQRPVDWMVCDIVDQPSRIAALTARWMAEGMCRRTIFNLKLPMKKRHDEVLRCGDLIRDALERRRLRYVLRFKQLYHDREEVTGYGAVLP